MEFLVQLGQLLSYWNVGFSSQKATFRKFTSFTFTSSLLFNVPTQYYLLCDLLMCNQMCILNYGKG